MEHADDETTTTRAHVGVSRREAFRTSLMGAAALVAGAALSSCGPRVAFAEAEVPESPFDVPRRLDVRAGEQCFNIRITRNGKELNHVIAYDLDEQWAVVYRINPETGHVDVHGGHAGEVLLLGGLKVEWTKEPEARVAFVREKTYGTAPGDPLVQKITFNDRLLSADESLVVTFDAGDVPSVMAVESPALRKPMTLYVKKVRPMLDRWARALEDVAGIKITRTE